MSVRDTSDIFRVILLRLFAAEDKERVRHFEQEKLLSIFEEERIAPGTGWTSLITKLAKFSLLQKKYKVTESNTKTSRVSCISGKG